MDNPPHHPQPLVPAATVCPHEEPVALACSRQSTDAPATTGSPKFYWQLPDAELGRLRSANAILEDEGYLAHDIHRGRELVTTAEDYEAVRDLDPDWEAPATPETYSDAIAAILQAAVEDGIDPEVIVAAAARTQAAVRAHAATAIRRT